MNIVLCVAFAICVCPGVSDIPSHASPVSTGPVGVSVTTAVISYRWWSWKNDICITINSAVVGGIAGNGSYSIVTV